MMKDEKRPRFAKNGETVNGGTPATQKSREKGNADEIIAEDDKNNQTKGEGKMTTISGKERVEIGKIKAKAIAELKRRGMEADPLFVWVDGRTIEGESGPETPGVLIERKGGRFVSRLFIPL